MGYRLDRRHNNNTAWNRNDRTLRGQYIGVELELEHNGGQQRLLDILPEPKSRKLRPSVEPDGSVPFGAEIVFPPFKYSTLKHKGSFFANAMKRLKEGGALETANTGMHLNVNTAHWDRFERMTFCALINWLPAKVLYNIGGRMPNMYCQRFFHPTIGGYVMGGHAAMRGATALREGGSRIELRFPHATVEHHKVVMLTHFIEAIEMMAKDMQQRPLIIDAIAQFDPMDFRVDGRTITENKVKTLVLNYIGGLNTKWAPTLKEVLLNGHAKPQAQEADQPLIAQAA